MSIRFKTGLVALTLLASFLLPDSLHAQVKLAFEPSSGYSDDSVNTNLVISIPPGERLNGFAVDIISNEIVSISSYKDLNAGCSLEVFKKDGVTTIICLAKPGEFLAGDREIVSLNLTKTSVGEADIFIENIDLGEGRESIASSATFVFETPDEPIVIEDEEKTVQTEGILFFKVASSWFENNYRSILFTVIGIGVAVSLFIVITKRRKLPSQLKLFTMLIVGLAAGTLFYANSELSDISMDTTSDAGEESFKPIESLESEGADLNGDGMIDLIDFEIMKSDLREWEENFKYYSRSDFNKDRDISVEDYLIFIELYNESNGTSGTTEEFSGDQLGEQTTQE